MKLVSFEGRAFEVGEKEAEVAGEAIAKTVGRLGRKRPSAEEVKAFVKACERVAPHFLEEMEAIARALDIRTDDLLSANASPPVRPEECTSFALASDMTTTRAPILHKNRDYYVEPQVAYFKRVEGFKRFLGSASPWDVGTAHFLNNSGLAGASNTGSPVKDTTEGGLTERHLMRLVAEVASACEDAVAIVEEVVKERIVCTENGTGAILLFADPKGIVVVEHSGRRFAWRKFSEGFVVRSNHFIFPEMADVMASEPSEDTKRRLAAVQAEIAPGGPPMEVRKAFSIMRKPEVCKGLTVSAFTHRLSARFSEVLSLAWVSLGPPLLSSFVPVPVCSSGVPEEWASGEAWVSPEPLGKSGKLPRKTELLEAAEGRLHKASEEALREAETYLRAGRRELSFGALSGRLLDWTKERRRVK